MIERAYFCSMRRCIVSVVIYGKGRGYITSRSQEQSEVKRHGGTIMRIPFNAT
jgi:hypothetical protein